MDENEKAVLLTAQIQEQILQNDAQQNTIAEERRLWVEAKAVYAEERPLREEAKRKAGEEKRKAEELKEAELAEDRRKDEEHRVRVRMEEQRVQIEVANAQIAEDRRIRKEAEAKTAEYTRLRKEAEAKTAEYTRLRKEAEAKAAEVEAELRKWTQPLIKLPKMSAFRASEQPSVISDRQTDVDQRDWRLVKSSVVPFEDSDLGTIAKRDLRSGLISYLYGREGLQFSCQHQISFFVTQILEDICAMLSLPVRVQFEEYLRGEENGRPDLVFVRGALGVIWTIVEVQRPHKSVFQENQVAFDQVVKYLQVAEENGVFLPMTILTTYEGWCIFWLDCSHGLATAKSINDVTNFFATLKVSNLAATSEDSNLATSPRTVYYSELIQYDDPRIIDHLLSFIYKCSKGPQVTQAGMLWLKFLPEKYIRNTIEMNKDDKALIATPPVVMPEHVVDNDGSLNYDIYFVRTLGSGADGRAVLVYMVAKKDTNNVKWCVVKFFEHFNSKETLVDRTRKAQREVEALKLAYPESKSVYLWLCNKPAVLMPYRIVLSESDFDSKATQDLIVSHVKELAMKGIMHEDLERRHVAWTDHEKNMDRKICFIDQTLGPAEEAPLEPAEEAPLEPAEEAPVLTKDEFIQNAVDVAKDSLELSLL